MPQCFLGSVPQITQDHPGHKLKTGRASRFYLCCSYMSGFGLNGLCSSLATGDDISVMKNRVENSMETG